MTTAETPTMAREFHAQAYDELKTRRPERELWAQAVANSEGDVKRAISTYVRERARVLEAQADAAVPNQINAWDHMQTPNQPVLPTAKRPPGLWLAVLGLWLISFVAQHGLAPSFHGAGGWELALVGSLAHALGAMLLGAGPGLVALVVNELTVRLGGASSLPRMRLFFAVSVGFAYPILLRALEII